MPPPLTNKEPVVSSSLVGIDNYSNEDVIVMMAACMQAIGTEGGTGRLLGLPVLLWGAPGVGKTARINKVAERLGFYNKDLTVLASVREPSDFIGIPLPGGKPVRTAAGEEVQALRFAPPLWAVNAAQHASDSGNPDDDKAVVFFDEFTTAGQRVMSAMLRVIHERVVGEFQLPRNVVMVAAANPPGMSPGGQDLKPPVANRFIHLYWVPPTPKQWGDWLTKDLPSATAQVEAQKELDDDYLTMDLDKFYKHLGDLKMHFARWVQTDSGKKYLFKMPGEEREDMKAWFEEHPNGDPAQGIPPGILPATELPGLTYDAQFTDLYAWPSPRSLEIACRARAAVQSINGISASQMGRLANAIVCATIGSQACEAINEHIALTLDTQVDPSEFVDNEAAREGFFVRQPAGDMQGVQLESVADYYLELPPEVALPMADDLTTAVLSFSGDGVSATFTPMSPAVLGSIVAKLKEWTVKNNQILDTNPDKVEQARTLGTATTTLSNKLRGV